MADYDARKKIANDSDKCECGHPLAAHSSAGMICAACSCVQFRTAFDPRFPGTTEVAP